MKNKNMIMALLMLIGISMTTYAQQVDADRYEINKYTARRSPALAAGLSLITLGFGGGQYYNKQYIKAGIVTAINTGTLIWLMAESDNNEGLEGLGEALLAAMIITANWAFSVIDAPISANAINKRYGLHRKVSISPAFQRHSWHTNGAISAGLKLTWSLD